MLETESVYCTFSDWILAQKRRTRPGGLYVVGVFGSVGQGKTVFSQAIASHLNRILKPEEGQAITRSLDDYYLTKGERYSPEFLARGYNPAGISNRGPAGTHDTERLWKDIGRMELSSSPAASGRGSMDSPPTPAGNDELLLPSFDKQNDDRSPEPYRVEGTVGVFIIEGWFMGANTDIDVNKAEPGLRRSVASALKRYKPLFERLDALWAFEPPASLDEIIVQRSEQEETTRKKTGKAGMTEEQIRRFVNYFYRDSWQEGLTSPVPAREAASFWATTDIRHRFIRIAASK